MNALDLAINQCKQRGNNKLKYDLLTVRSLLPENSVIAYMEAEARGMRSEFISMLRITFHLRPFR